MSRSRRPPPSRSRVDRDRVPHGVPGSGSVRPWAPAHHTQHSIRTTHTLPGHGARRSMCRGDGGGHGIGGVVRSVARDGPRVVVGDLHAERAEKIASGSVASRSSATWATPPWSARWSTAPRPRTDRCTSSARTQESGIAVPIWRRPPTRCAPSSTQAARARLGGGARAPGDGRGGAPGTWCRRFVGCADHRTVRMGYTLTKHGALGFAEWVALNYAHLGITVTCLCPNAVNTGMLGRDEDDEDGRKGLRRSSRTRRRGRARARRRHTLAAMAPRRFLALPHPGWASRSCARRATTTAAGRHDPSPAPHAARGRLTQFPDQTRVPRARTRRRSGRGAALPR